MSAERPLSIEQILSLDWKIQPKRQLDIPELDLETIAAKWPRLIGRVNRMIIFLNSRAIADDLGADHETRREQRYLLFEKYQQQYGEEIALELYRLYKTENQLRNNILTTAKLSSEYVITILKRLADEGHDVNEMLNRAKFLFAEMHAMQRGDISPSNPEVFYPGYRTLENVEDKMEIVRFFENSIIELLGIVKVIQDMD